MNPPFHWPYLLLAIGIVLTVIWIVTIMYSPLHYLFGL